MIMQEHVKVLGFY